MTITTLTYVDGIPKLTVYRDGETVVAVTLTDAALAALVADGAIILRHVTQTRVVT